MRTIPLLGLAAVLVAGCGGHGPPLDPATGARLAREADAVAARAAAGDACGATARAQTLQRDTIVAINDQRIPPRYQEALQARVDELVAELQPRCLPAPPPAATAPAPASGSGGGENAQGGKPPKHGGGRGHGAKGHGGEDG